MENLRGLIAATFSPFKPDGSLDLEKVPDMVKMLVKNKVTGIFVCGSTGEGPSLSTNERKILAEAFVTESREKLKVLVHVGHNSLREARDLAKHAQEIGADFISATPPAYFKIDSNLNLVNCLAEIASGAPELPFYYYNIPALTGVNLDMVNFLEIAKEKLPSLVGIKYTTPYINEYQSCLNASNKEYDILFGSDEILLGALASGALGFIGSTFNFAAPLYYKVIEAFNQCDMENARNLQLQSVEMVRIIVKFGGLRAQKAMMKLIGMDCGTVRLPLNSFTSEECTLLEKDLKKIDFFEWACKGNKKVTE